MTWQPGQPPAQPQTQAQPAKQPAAKPAAQTPLQVTTPAQQQAQQGQQPQSSPGMANPPGPGQKHSVQIDPTMQGAINKTLPPGQVAAQSLSGKPRQNIDMRQPIDTLVNYVDASGKRGKPIKASIPLSQYVQLHQAQLSGAPYILKGVGEVKLTSVVGTSKAGNKSTAKAGGQGGQQKPAAAQPQAQAQPAAQPQAQQPAAQPQGTTNNLLAQIAQKKAALTKPAPPAKPKP
jgi:hypothetical protein